MQSMLSNAARLPIGLLVFLPSSLHATYPDRDFSGVWILDEQRSDVRGLSVAPGALLTISQQGSTIQAIESDKAGKSSL